MIQTSRGREQKEAAAAALAKQPHPPADAVRSAQTVGSRSWSSSALRNPRIVRVSRAFGGKDRHSKVRTVRGLRDRRVRLSVPTAIQLYDLQDKLGLSQPSKVVDWLLAASQHEIDKLPPLDLLQLGGGGGGGGDGHLLFDPNLPNSIGSEKSQAPAAGDLLGRSEEGNEGMNAAGLRHNGFVLESGNPNIISNYCSVESGFPSSNNANNYLISQVHPGYYHHPIAILASYMAAAGSAAQNDGSSGGLKVVHGGGNGIVVPSLMAHELYRDTGAAASSRALHHQYQ